MATKKERMTNFKTYEAQARLLAALVASLPKNFRFDYKSIAQYYGGEATESAMEHRFRPVKAQAECVKHLVAKKRDPLEVRVYEIKTQADIQKYFGESTADGLAFQFRSVKKGAEICKTAADDGKSPVEAFSKHLGGNSGGAGSVPATPSTKRAATPSTKRAASARTSATPATKRRKTPKIEPETEYDDDEDSPEVDYSELDSSTPTKQKRPERLSHELLPRSAWAKPVDKKSRVPSQLSSMSSPAPPRQATPAAPSFTLAPIAGVGSFTAPNGYTDPATGLALNSSASPSAANSPATGRVARRRSSAFSTSNSPDTPSMSYAEPALGINQSLTTNSGTTNARTNRNPTIDANPFTRTGSPPASISDAHSPETTASSHTMASGRRASTNISKKNNGTSFQTDDSLSFNSSFVVTDRGTAAAARDTFAYSFADRQDIAFASQADFGSFEDDEQEEEWDAGDC